MHSVVGRQRVTPRGRKVCYGSVSYRGWGARWLPGELAVDEYCRHIGKVVNLYALYVCMYGWMDFCVLR